MLESCPAANVHKPLLAAGVPATKRGNSSGSGVMLKGQDVRESLAFHAYVVALVSTRLRAVPR